MKEDEKYMMQCLDLARHGLGTTYPNPLVGSVIVHEGEVISTAFHRKSGEPHAEALAIRAVQNKQVLKASTLYVNLEPCAHYGKTPPCASLIVKNRIPRVVIGTTDTSEKVAGKGIEILQQGGCEVVTGVLEKQCRFINRRFFTSNEKERPYVILKWAESADGFLDIQRTPESKPGPNWISGPLGRQLVHKWRSEEQAILVGTRTAQIDDPALTVREWSGTQPLRLVIDMNLSLPDQLKLFNRDVPTVVFNAINNTEDNNLKLVKLDFSGSITDAILSYLHRLNIQSLMVEGGGKTLRHFIDENSWDEARVIKGETKFYAGIPAPDLTMFDGITEMLPDTKYKIIHRVKL